MTTADIRLTAREKQCLEEAQQNPGGWQIFMPKTSSALAKRGLMEHAQHPHYGTRYRITDEGRRSIP